MKVFTSLLNVFFTVLTFAQLDSLPTTYYGELPFSPLEGSSNLELIQGETRVLKHNIDLSNRFPPAGNQKKSNSCWAFATTYAYLSYFKNGDNPNNFFTMEGHPNYDKIFSPAFTYNLYKDDGSMCQGKNRSIEVLNKLLKDGGVSFREFPFPDDSCIREINSELKEKAKRNAVRNYYVQSTTDLYTMKSLLSDGTPLVIAIMLDNNFKQIGYTWKTKKLSYPLWKEFGQRSETHAMVITGFNDNYNAFKVLNSWGTDFGDKGYIWISYDIFNSQEFYYAAYLQEIKLRRRGNLEGLTAETKKSKQVEEPTKLYPTWVKKKYYRKYDGLRFALTAFKAKKGFGLIRVLDDTGKELRSFYIEKGQKVNFTIEDQKYGFRFDNVARVDGTNPFTKAMYFTIEKY